MKQGTSVHAKFTARSKWSISDVMKVQISAKTSTRATKTYKRSRFSSLYFMQRKPETEFLSRMQSATLLVVLTLASYSTGAAVQLRLNCNSQLRLVLPALFAHCSCSYSEWSAWEAVPNSVVSVPTSQCRSNESYNETRTQSAIGQGCRSRTQTRSVCKYTY